MGVSKQKLNHPGVRGVVEDPSVAHLFPCEQLVVVIQRCLNCVVFRMVRLNDDLAGTISSAGPACELSQEVIGALHCPEIREAQVGIRQEHTGQCDPRKVVALGHHLRADQDLSLAIGEPLENRGSLSTTA